MSGSPKMVGTALTGASWRTYFVSAEGTLLLRAGGAPFGLGARARVIAEYGSVAEALAAAHRALQRDVRYATVDMRVVFPDVAALIARSVEIGWIEPPAPEGPVDPAVARASLGSALLSR